MLKLKAVCVLAICVGLLVAAQAQSPPFPGTFPQGVFTNRAALDASSGFTPSCSQSSAWLARATLVTATVDKTAYDTMICGMVTDGTWTLLDVFYVWAAPDSTTAQLNLVSSSFTGTPSGTSGGFTAHQGITGSSTGSYFIDSGFNPGSAPSPHYTQNSATVGVYVQSNRTSGGNQYEFGASAAGGIALVLGDIYQFGAFNMGINTSTIIINSNSGVQGSWNLTRTTSSSELVYQNSNETAVGSASDTSGPVPADDIFLFSYDLGVNNTNDQMSAGWIGAGVTAVQSCKINNRINTFLAGYGNNVYSNSAC